MNEHSLSIVIKGVLVARLRETLKPKTLLYSFMSFLSRVLFPAPEGPLSTTGLGPAIAEGKREKRPVK